MSIYQMMLLNGGECKKCGCVIRMKGKLVILRRQGRIMYSMYIRALCTCKCIEAYHIYDILYFMISMEF